MHRPTILDDFKKSHLGKAAICVIPSLKDFVQKHLPIPHWEDGDSWDAIETLIVVGGGNLIDKMKLKVRTEAPNIRLIAVPSLWGSGAEVSPVVVTAESDVKVIRVDSKYIPDKWVLWPELADSLPTSLLKNGCGDSWSHVLEGFLSPLASDDLRKECAELIAQMSQLPLDRDPRWFLLSARACDAQARASVGLIHGIAHTLELPLKQIDPSSTWGHASLCSLYLLPVMSFNRKNSPKLSEYFKRYQIHEESVFKILRELFNQDLYMKTLPLLKDLWRKILTDPCTRTNSVLVRPASLAFFELGDF